MEEISIKMYAPNGGSVRRFPFQIPVGANGSVSYDGIYSLLLDKVKQIYPVKAGSRFEMAWKDEEGDLIVMNTDDEVKEALRHRKGDIFRIFPRVVNGLESVRVASPVQEKEPTDDFVAVERSESVEKTGAQQQGLQRQEQKPEGAKKIHNGIICDGCGQNGIEEVRYKCLICRDYDLCAICEGKRIHDQHPMIRLTQPGDRSWVACFMAAQGMTLFPFHGGRHGRCPFYAGQERRQTTGGQPEQHPQQADQQRAQEIPGASFLRDVGQAVAAVLDGFGIDVDVDVEHDGQRSNVATARTEKKEEKAEEKKQDGGTNVSKEQPMENVASPPTVTVDSGNKTPDGQQEWMILENPDITPLQETPPAAAASAPPASSNPRVNYALEYMLGMGFPNEGDWLTHMLEATDGDIPTVLEILHPSGRP